MNERIEQLLQLKKMCVFELEQAQTSSERYLSIMKILAENLKTNWQDTSYILSEYDSFITNITTIMEVTRKFNLQLHMYNLKLSEMQSTFSKMNRNKELQKYSCNGLLMDPLSHLYPAEVFEQTCQTGEDFVYPRLNLNQVYKENDIINGTVTYIDNLSNLSFYIFDNSSEYRTAIVELSKSVDLRQYHDMPSTFEVFGCVLDQQIYRAVLGSKTLYDAEVNEEIYPCFILDTGEILPLKSNHIMYKLTNDQKNIPGLALHCQLKITNKNPFLSRESIEDKLKTLEYKKCNLKVLGVECNILHVEFVNKPNEFAKDNVLEKKTIENISLNTDSNSALPKQLTEEELEVLFEEPLSTSNAMKAVMGYDPQDDKRICRFYDASTGGCFKGVNCKLEHTFRQPDGWTKDILPTASIIDYRHPVTVFSSGSIINITPTYVGRLDRFYAQINNLHKTSTPLVWNDEDVPSWKLLQKPPLMFDLVLSRYIDGLWYRAKIVFHDDDYKMFKVFYVDYGNIQMVHFRNLASIDINTAQLPFQAVLCRFESVNENPSLSASERKNYIDILCELILNKSIDVKVVSHYEDLFILFLDKTDYPIPDMLIEKGCLLLNKQ